MFALWEGGDALSDFQMVYLLQTQIALVFVIATYIEMRKNNDKEK